MAIGVLLPEWQDQKPHSIQEWLFPKRLRITPLAGAHGPQQVAVSPAWQVEAKRNRVCGNLLRQGITELLWERDSRLGPALCGGSIAPFFPRPVLRRGLLEMVEAQLRSWDPAWETAVFEDGEDPADEQLMLCLAKRIHLLTLCSSRGAAAQDLCDRMLFHYGIPCRLAQGLSRPVGAAVRLCSPDRPHALEARVVGAGVSLHRARAGDSLVDDWQLGPQPRQERPAGIRRCEWEALLNPALLLDKGGANAYNHL